MDLKVDDRGWIQVRGSVLSFWVHPSDHESSLLRQMYALEEQCR